MLFLFYFFLILYALLSIIYQIEGRVKNKLAELDRMGLLPSWAFFAPNPGISDFRIIFKDYLDDKTESDWEEVNLYSNKSFYRFLWNPDKLMQKCIYDCIQSFLLKAVDSHNQSLLILSWDYIKLLELVIEEQHKLTTSKIRFVILSSQGFLPTRETSLLYVSRKHPIRHAST
ncbi:hypothetical protein E4631_25120 [Hymenobacter sp. UV11]|uniref:hypothetical protein n=1 Tax=Hymenobacter sp. UV11 TaxID=1849735 RepID=UPI00105FE8F0|nr:hypothetical protein [Hymenobacter sp. UV11]TFZ62440.1 hypothetical protein E4631_25120 [Hymenobacter sp. UV11]